MTVQITSLGLRSGEYSGRSTGSKRVLVIAAFVKVRNTMLLNMTNVCAEMVQKVLSNGQEERGKIVRIIR